MKNLISRNNAYLETGISYQMITMISVKQLSPKEEHVLRSRHKGSREGRLHAKPLCTVHCESSRRACVEKLPGSPWFPAGVPLLTRWRAPGGFSRLLLLAPCSMLSTDKSVWHLLMLVRYFLNEIWKGMNDFWEFRRKSIIQMLYSDNKSLYFRQCSILDRRRKAMTSV